MSIWFPIFCTLLAIILWTAIWSQNDENMQALIIAGSLGAPVVAPILAVVSWYLYLTT
jgi:hypothetical protein